MTNDRSTIAAGLAVVKVLEAWQVDHLYGIPGGSFNSIMDALSAERENIHYIQVRHEEVGAMAAAADAKLTGKIGVCFGSAGPGGTHLMNGLYDAREDHVPVLALIGQFGTTGMNMDTFQEMNENPIYADVAAYNVTAVSARTLPHVIDEAIRRAYANQGVSVVQIPVDLPWQEIPQDSWYASAINHQKPLLPVPDPDLVKKLTQQLVDAKRPVIYYGIGAYTAGKELQQLSELLKIPLMSTYPAKGIVPDSYPAYLGSANRVAQKPANEALAQADTVLFIGNNYPFAEVSNAFKNTQHFLQIDVDPAKLGKRHQAEVAILADAKATLQQVLEQVSEREETPWWKANLANRQNWRDYLSKLENKQFGELQAYQVLKAVNDIADEDAIFSIDVGDINLNANRNLNLTPKNRHFTSNLFATMGVGIPGAIAAKLDFPDRQIFNLSGDGGAAMTMQDLVTQVQYHLPAINVIFTNKQYAFIKDEQEDTNKNDFIGVEFDDIDFSLVAKAVNMKGFRVTKIEDLAPTFAKAKEIAKTEPVLIDAVISGDRPMPVEKLQLDPAKFSQEEIDAFVKRYEAQDLRPFADFLKEAGLSVRDAENSEGGF
ncbi:pyruvate oxidase [Lacticaseibacillus casei]|uniref:Pyruvate oxidase n=2 Tax=Lacticaseibacillus TaxID=2759736 RepID=A0ABY8DSM4_9LACO|nr:MULTISPECIES: pyruvate oxidase [Lacticaseibacillus]MDG3061240.1 pyruvate oxidase [Lacticaseibacillus sp. BCRC 81376]QXG60458.1 pyruvate oxidase [Lacticaseibacillus casei]WFB37986.1 pyruvate oxidase [Lacticaseibacillus huelsenbergensis]